MHHRPSRCRTCPNVIAALSERRNPQPKGMGDEPALWKEAPNREGCKVRRRGRVAIHRPLTGASRAQVQEDSLRELTTFQRGRRIPSLTPARGHSILIPPFPFPEAGHVMFLTTS
jgi:hypothetical protein